jgi:hypothetical protein
MSKKIEAKIRTWEKNWNSVISGVKVSGFVCEKCGSEPTAIACLGTQNLYFLTERLLEGQFDDLISVIRVAWTNPNIGEELTRIEREVRKYQKPIEGSSQ